MMVADHPIMQIRDVLCLLIMAAHRCYESGKHVFYIMVEDHPIFVDPLCIKLLMVVDHQRII